ncbi:HpcH/HpaI aldolase/citrate lyase family protein [Marimonas sp. MJW-29]|uniref:HpcH/HpaI aldolase/citrate lyase family protein n=1 Tax=Sulfitobacter sediminis TaxID=3234186 RepID=A0ABV3RKY3_9RHOB
MKLPPNRFKAALREGCHQLGIWNTIGGNTVPEFLGGAGFDWVLIDCEHAAIETVEVLPALQAVAANPDVSALVRPAANDPVLFKRLLDMGAQTLLVPYVQSRDEAEAAVSAMRYGPRGMRGMAGMTRATRYGKVENYFTTAEQELCLILQIETLAGLEALEEIATTDGVDAIFFGPADLSASMGLPGQMRHPDVVAAIEDGLARLAALDVPGGLMALDPEEAKHFMGKGSRFTAVGVDLVLLAEAVAALRARF